MATLRTRLDALERTSTEPNQGGYLDLQPVMAYDEWCEAAQLQQAALLKDTYENT